MNYMYAEYTSLIDKTNYFRKKLIVFKCLKCNDKLTINNGEFNIDDGISYVPLWMSRWWYNHNRKDICILLTDILNNYCCCLDTLLIEFSKGPVEKTKFDLIENSVMEMDVIIAGLENLRTTYINYHELAEKIETSCKLMNKFCERVDEIKEIRKITNIDEID